MLHLILCALLKNRYVTCKEVILSMEYKFVTKEELAKTLYSEDDYDYSDASKFKHKVKICLACNKEFYPESRSYAGQKVCKRSHYTLCPVCGKPVFQVRPLELKCTCEGKCAKVFKRDQTKASLVARYGVENISQCPEFKEKISQSIKSVSAQITAKAAATMKERYGGVGTASPLLRAKIEGTMQEKYGVTNPDELPEFRKKISEALKSSEFIEKRKASSRAKYGTDFPTQSDEVKQLMAETLMKNHGVPFSGQIPESRIKAANTCMERYGVPNALQLDSSREKAAKICVEHQTGRSSKINRRFADKLRENGFDIEEEFYVGRKSFDCGIESLKTVIEVDPSYTHSTMPSHWERTGKEPNYHLERTQLAVSNGYRCIHIFDWDSWDKIISTLKCENTIYARKCILKEIDANSASEFIDNYHIQGKVSGTAKAYGLIHDGELVEVMTFGKPRYNKNYEWELLRLCSKTGVKVVGGASKLFKKFVADNCPKSIISYCDLAKFSGEVYKQIGMELHHISDPAKVWSKGDKYVTDNLLRQRGYDQLFNANYGKGTSNEQLMLEHHWLPVYDCGQAVFVKVF